jgi:hypothetical protein
MAIKITISKQMVACDKKKTALVCFWSENITRVPFPGQEKHVHVQFSHYIPLWHSIISQRSTLPIFGGTKQLDVPEIHVWAAIKLKLSHLSGTWKGLG